MDKLSRTRVLIVEDEPDIAGLMKHALERGGDMGVEIVGTGAAALKSVMEEPPGLVLLDLNLPFIDGLEVCRLLRGRPSSAAIPIIMVTARTSEADRVAGLELGADDYVTKPFSLRELVARVRAVLRRPPQTDVASRTSAIGTARWRSISTPCRYACPGTYQADQARVRAAALSRREPEPRALSRPAARAGLGTRSPGRNAIGRRARRTPAQQAGHAGRQIETVIGMGYRFVEEPNSLEE